ncbi:MAG: hypothetical protein RXR01_07720 [Thermoproteus sp.]
MSYNPTAPGGPVVCTSNALPVIDRTRSQCGQTIQVPSSGLWYTLYVTAIRGDTTFGVDPGKLVQVYPFQVSISAGQWDCDPTVFGHILKGSTCRYKFFVQASTTGSVKFVLTAGGDSCTVYFAPQGAQPTPSPSPSPSPTPPQPQPTAPSCDAFFPPPCDRPGYTCTQAMGVCCCNKLAQPPQPSPCPSGTSCLDYSLCETSGGTCESDCGVGCCCRKTSPAPMPTPSPSPTPVPTPSPSPKPECPTGTVCVDPSLCGGGGTCVSSCSLGCCCQPPSNIPPPPPPAPQPPSAFRRPQPF